MRPWDSFSLAEHGVEKVIARRAAMELKRGMTGKPGLRHFRHGAALFLFWKKVTRRR